MTAKYAPHFLRLLLLTVALCLSATSSDAQELYQLVLSDLPLEKGERVVAFELKVKAGAINSVKNIPVGWYLEVDNDGSWLVRLAGGAKIGSAALSMKRLENISVILEKNEFQGLEFDVSAEIVATTDFQAERHILVQKNSLKLTRL